MLILLASKPNRTTAITIKATAHRIFKIFDIKAKEVSEIPIFIIVEVFKKFQ